MVLLLAKREFDVIPSGGQPGSKQGQQYWGLAGVPAGILRGRQEDKLWLGVSFHRGQRKCEILCNVEIVAGAAASTLKLLLFRGAHHAVKQELAAGLS